MTDKKVDFSHKPVMVSEVLEYLPLKTGGILIDGTLGGGGHSEALLRKSKIKSQKLKVIGIDRDLEAIFAAKNNLAEFADQITFIHDNFSNLPSILKSQEIDKIDGILLDLGVSSYQLDNAKRGFSFQNNAPLDMRMNRSDKESAADIVNNYSENDLADIFYDWGGERNSRRIAKNIVEGRKKNKITTTGQLSAIIESSFPANYKNKYKIHPATRVFQALRIEVNDELKVLENFIPKAAELLAGDGRLMIISFHSLEDRIVKHSFRKLEEENNEKFKVLTKKPITASEEEIAQNPRSRSAKLRVLEKTN